VNGYINSPTTISLGVITQITSSTLNVVSGMLKTPVFWLNTLPLVYLWLNLQNFCASLIQNWQIFPLRVPPQLIPARLVTL
jgi:hypothetical protein